jgi:U3 small nucleolar RNA-associated protein 23
MGRKKNKLVKKATNFYKFVFKFDPPFNILLDGNFIAIAKQKKLNMKEILEKNLDEKVHLTITSCVVQELREFDCKIPGLLNSIMNYKIEECSHKPTTPENCIKSLVGTKNKKKYFVATQDIMLRNQLRKFVAVPLVLFEQNMIILEKPSKASMEAYDKVNFFYFIL